MYAKHAIDLLDLEGVISPPVIQIVAETSNQ